MRLVFLDLHRGWVQARVLTLHRSSREVFGDGPVQSLAPRGGRVLRLLLVCAFLFRGRWESVPPSQQKV